MDQIKLRTVQDEAHATWLEHLMDRCVVEHNAEEEARKIADEARMQEPAIPDYIGAAEATRKPSKLKRVAEWVAIGALTAFIGLGTCEQYISDKAAEIEAEREENSKKPYDAVEFMF